jgi:hypothetical protein
MVVAVAVREPARARRPARAIAGIMEEGAKLEADAARQETEILAIIEQRLKS